MAASLLDKRHRTLSHAQGPSFAADQAGSPSKEPRWLDAASMSETEVPAVPLKPFDPVKATAMLREGLSSAMDSKSGDQSAAALAELNRLIVGTPAIDAARHCQDLVVELFKPLSLPSLRFDRRLAQLQILRVVLLRLNPLVAVFKFDNVFKERIANTLVNAAASDFLTGGVCFDMLNALFFALDYTNINSFDNQLQACAVASQTFHQAADCIQNMESMQLNRVFAPSRSSWPFPSVAASHAGARAVLQAKEAVKEALIFILSSREQVLTSSLSMLVSIGRRLVQQPSLGFAIADDVFDTLEDPEAVNESYVFNAMLEHDDLGRFVGNLVKNIVKQGQHAPERFTLQRLMYHGYAKLRDSGCLRTAVLDAIDELRLRSDPSLAYVLCSCSSVVRPDDNSALAINMAETICVPIFQAIFDADPSLGMLSNVVRQAPSCFLDACEVEPELEARLDELLSQVARNGGDCVANLGRCVFNLSYARPQWYCGTPERAENMCKLTRRMLFEEAASAGLAAQWLRAQRPYCASEQLNAAALRYCAELSILLSNYGAVVDSSRFATTDWTVALPGLDAQDKAGVIAAWDVLLHAVDWTNLCNASNAGLNLGPMEIVTLFAATAQCKVRAAVIVAIRDHLFELDPFLAETVDAFLKGSSSFAKALIAWMECPE